LSGVAMFEFEALELELESYLPREPGPELGL
jgi:hypothetical protein